jgi:CrcB protein
MPRLIDVALVGAGGALGSVARYLVGLTLAALLGPALPYGTFAVNVTGSFAAGLLLGVAEVRDVTTAMRLVLLTGFLGGYTTFSAFSIETVRLAEQQGLLGGATNVAANLVLGLGAAVLGVAIGRSY